MVFKTGGLEVSHRKRCLPRGSAPTPAGNRLDKTGFPFWGGRGACTSFRGRPDARRKHRGPRSRSVSKGSLGPLCVVGLWSPTLIFPANVECTRAAPGCGASFPGDLLLPVRPGGPEISGRIRSGRNRDVGARRRTTTAVTVRSEICNRGHGMGSPAQSVQ